MIPLPPLHSLVFRRTMPYYEILISASPQQKSSFFISINSMGDEIFFEWNPKEDETVSESFTAIFAEAEKLVRISAMSEMKTLRTAGLQLS